MTDPLQLFTEPEPVPIPDTGVVDATRGKAVHVRTGRTSWGRTTAVFDRDEQFRYRLSHERGDGRGQRVCWVMLNPSTATETVLDPTVKRTLTFADDWGFQSSEVTNLFALRSTDPKALYDYDSRKYGMTDPIGVLNDEMIVAAASRADLVVAAWGVHSQLRGRGYRVQHMLWDLDIDLHYVSLTKDGIPGHPLYVKRDSEPRIFERKPRSPVLR